MSRTFVILAALAVPLLLGAAPRLKTPDPAHPVGNWRITFTNGVVETCEIKHDGSAAESEPLRSSPGKWKEVDRSVVVTFDDDRLELDEGWTRMEGRALVPGRGVPRRGSSRRECPAQALTSRYTSLCLEWRTIMPTYILLGTFTDQGIRAIKETTKRAEGVRGLAQKLGVTVKDVYWTQGAFDTVLIVDAPDESAITALGLTIGSLGNVRTTTLRAFSAAEIGQVLGKLA